MMSLMEFMCYDVGKCRNFPGWVVGARSKIDGSNNKRIEACSDTPMKYLENRAIMGHQHSILTIDYHEACYVPYDSWRQRCA